MTFETTAQQHTRRRLSLSLRAQPHAIPQRWAGGATKGGPPTALQHRHLALLAQLGEACKDGLLELGRVVRQLRAHPELLQFATEALDRAHPFADGEELQKGHNALQLGILLIWVIRGLVLGDSDAVVCVGGRTSTESDTGHAHEACTVAIRRWSMLCSGVRPRAPGWKE